MLLSGHAVNMVSDIVTADDFYRPAHRHVFAAIQSLAGSGQGVDPVTVAEELDRSGLLEASGGKASLVSLQARTPAITNAEHYARIVEEKALLRRLVVAAGEIAEMGFAPRDSIEKTLDDAESSIFAVAQRRQSDTQEKLDVLVGRAFDTILKRAEQGSTVTGTPTGFAQLDTVLLGLQPGALIVVGARPGMGKTAFALGLAAHASVREGLPVLFFSLEMGHMEITERLVAAEASIDSTKLRTGALTSNDWSRITAASDRLGAGPMWIDDNPAVTLMEIRAKARRLQDRVGTPLGLVVVDYLQLMQGRTSAESRQVEVAEISRGLKVLARELQAPVLALSQLSRQLEQRSDKRPNLADLRESGCMPAHTRLRRSDDNSEVTLGELVESGAENVPVWSLDDDWRLVPAVLTHAFPSGVKEVFRLRLSSGRVVEATANHPFRTVAGWRRLDELAPGSRIAVPRVLPAADRVGSLEPDNLQELAADAVADGEVPHIVHVLADNQLATVLAGVFERIGYISVTTLRGRPHVRLAATTCSRRLVDDIQTLLLRFGIQGRITDVGRNRSRWRIWIHGAGNQREFFEKVGMGAARAADVTAALEVLGGTRSNPNVDTVPCEVRDIVVEELARLGMTQRELAEALGEQYCGGYLLGTDSRPRSSGRDRLARIAEATGSKDLAALATSDVFWDEVVEVASLGNQEVFDATVLGTHNFIADGVIAHNSIEQDADVVMFLYRDEKYNADSPDKGTAEVIVAKHRAGPVDTCRLVFMDKYATFKNAAASGVSADLE
jgi:replicative DNA helicase